MSKLITTFIAAVFAVVAATPVAFADKHMKDEKKTEMKKDTKKAAPKKDTKKAKAAPKKDAKKAAPKKEDKKDEKK